MTSDTEEAPQIIFFLVLLLLMMPEGGREFWTHQREKTKVDIDVDMLAGGAI